MLFCARSGDEQAVNAVLVLSNAPCSEIRILDPQGQVPPPSAVFFYTDENAVFKSNVRILRPLGTWKRNDTPPALSERDAAAGFTPPQVAKRAGAIIALRPKPRSVESFKDSIEHLYEQLTGSPFNPEARKEAREERKMRRKEGAEEPEELGDSIMDAGYSLYRTKTYP